MMAGASEGSTELRWESTSKLSGQMVDVSDTKTDSGLLRTGSMPKDRATFSQSK